MYKGFNLELDVDLSELPESLEFYNKGKSIFERKKLDINKTLEGFLLENGNIDGTKMQENWFPQIRSDIFISHSHKDEKQAIILAGLLNEVFNLELFIDSCVWGNSNALLKKIDDKFCKQTNGSYNYEKRNFSTSHVHMMLSTALNMMIDNTECLFFINTPNSITTSSLINRTESPWIYSEITMSKLIRKKELKRFRKENLIMFSKGVKLSLNESFEYKLDLEHLTNINLKDIFNWLGAYKQEYYNTPYPLDILYRQHSNLIGG